MDPNVKSSDVCLDFLRPLADHGHDVEAWADATNACVDWEHLYNTRGPGRGRGACSSSGEGKSMTSKRASETNEQRDWGWGGQAWTSACFDWL